MEHKFSLFWDVNSGMWAFPFRTMRIAFCVLLSSHYIFFIANICIEFIRLVRFVRMWDMHFELMDILAFCIINFERYKFVFWQDNFYPVWIMVIGPPYRYRIVINRRRFFTFNEGVKLAEWCGICRECFIAVCVVRRRFTVWLNVAISVVLSFLIFFNFEHADHIKVYRSLHIGAVL